MAGGFGAASKVFRMALQSGVLALGAGGAALTSDLFVEALKPTMASLGLSEAFVGLVIVAIAGNAVENVVGVQAAAAASTSALALKSPARKACLQNTK